jgi:ribonuclease Y
MDYVAAVLGGLVVGALVGLFFDRLRMGAAYRTRDQLMEHAKTDADNFRKTKELEIKEDLLKRREDLETDLRKVRNELHEFERKLDKRESDLGQQQSEFQKKEKMLQTTQNRLSERVKVVETQERELDRMLKAEQEELFKISGLTREQASDRLMTRLDQELKAEAGRLIMKRESELKQNAEKIAREVIGMAVQRYASAHTSETTVSTIDIPSDEIKGRIIGREGRNIRAFEKETGVDVIVDDTPGVVVVSCFDTVRREIAKRSLV